MLKNTFILLIATLFAACNSGSDQNASARPAQKIELLSPDEFEEKLKKSGNHTLLDIRTNMEVQDGHLKDMTQIDWFEENFEERVKNTIAQEDTVFVYCAIGGRSEEAAEKLAEMGYAKVYDLNGGYNRWFEQQKPIVKPSEL